MMTMSSPSSSVGWVRKDSRMTLLIRFLDVALRQCFLEMARPSRACSSLLARQSTVKNLSRLRVAFLNTRPKAAASNSRFTFWNRRPLLLVNPVFWFVVVTVAYTLRRQLRAAFCAAALENESPGFGGHTGTKTVGACAFDFAGLVCAFHYNYLGRNPQRRAVFQKVGKVTQMPRQCQ
jgi:hypothetical protein